MEKWRLELTSKGPLITETLRVTSTLFCLLFLEVAFSQLNRRIYEVNFWLAWNIYQTKAFLSSMICPCLDSCVFAGGKYFCELHNITKVKKCIKPTSMSQSTKRKHVTDEVLNDFELPKDNQKIVRVVAGRGNNLHQVTIFCVIIYQIHLFPVVMQ